MTVRSDLFVSVVAPVRNDAGIVGPFVDEVIAVLRTHYLNYELVIVDDASEDGTVEAIRPLLERYECIRVVQLSREFGEEIAIAAGLDSVIGDFVVVMVPNTDPPALIPAFVDRARQGAGVVFGIRSERVGDSALVRLFAPLFYWYDRHFLHLNIPKDSSQFRALSRQAVNAVVQIRDRSRYLRVLSADVGYAHTGIAYQPINRNPDRAVRSLWNRLNVAIDIVIANSRHPLRFVTLLGVTGAALNALYALYVLVVFFNKRQVAEGWTTLSLQSAGMFFLVCLVLTVLSEYVGHILVELSHRPLYYVRDEQNSRAPIADQDRRNVVTQSLAP